MIKLWAIILLMLILALALSILLSQEWLSKTYYTCKNAKVTHPVKIIQLTDLHNHQFGKSNGRLVQKIASENPDAIFMTGDMINDDEEDLDILLELIRDLEQVAPVYASLGNHEKAYMENHGGDTGLIRQMEEAGATVLEQTYIDTEIAGQPVRIGGLYGYVLAGEWGDGSEQRFMETFEQTDRLKILLSHIPEGLLLWKSMEHWQVDLVFSGHVHGGQIRIPFIGGLFDPEEGYFPTYTKGMFACGYGTMILSAGLGSSQGIPRVFPG